MKELQVNHSSNQQITVDDIEITALVPDEMLSAQSKLLTWCEKKLASVKHDVKELKQAHEHAKSHKWATATLHRHHGLAVKKAQYYEKLKAAVEAGYFIVPNFPVQLFAVRTDKGKPARMLTTDRWCNASEKEQKTHDVPLGEGEYKSALPILGQSYVLDEAKQTRNFWAKEWDDEIDFPINMAKPIIMEATTRAMALKIFDRFGVMPSVRKNDDPVIIGQIVAKRGWQEKTISFMVAWFLDTQIL